MSARDLTAQRSHTRRGDLAFATTRAGTAGFEIRLVVAEGADVPDGTCEGSVSYAARNYRFLCRFGARSTPQEIEILSVDGVEYVRLEGALIGFSGDPAKPWTRSELDEDDDEFFRILDPVALLALLRSASRSTSSKTPNRSSARGAQRPQRPLSRKTPL